MKRDGIKPSSLIVDIHHHGGVDAANTVNVKYRELISFNAIKGSTLNHRNISQNMIWTFAGAQISPRTVVESQASLLFKLVRKRTKLWKTKPWQIAAKVLHEAAEHGGPFVFVARIVFCKAVLGESRRRSAICKASTAIIRESESWQGIDRYAEMQKPRYRPRPVAGLALLGGTLVETEGRAAAQPAFCDDL